MTKATPDWKRLGEQLMRRRIETDPRYSNRQLFTDERGLNYRTVSDIENGRRDNYEDQTLAAIEIAYRLAPGSIRRSLASGALEPLSAAPLSAVPSPSSPYAPADVKDEVITLQLGMIRELVPHLPQEMQETVGRWMDLIDATWRLPQDDRAELLLQVLQRRLPRPAGSVPPPGERRPGTAS